MRRSRTPSFSCEFPLKAGLKEVAILGSRFEAARQLKNAILGAALSRLARMRRDPQFERAKAMPRGATGEKATPGQKAQALARRSAFGSLRTRYAFHEYALHAHSSLAPSCWIRGHLDINTAQKTATRAFQAAERWACGRGGRPHFARVGEVESVEGKTNLSGIRFRDGFILWKGAHADLRLGLRVDPGNPVQVHALALAREGKVKYVRLLLRRIRGRLLAYAQLVLEGLPLVRKNPDGSPRHPVVVGDVALDMGPSQVAVVAEGRAEILRFCPGLDRKEGARRRYLRRLDRQRRANNPGNYREDGTVRPLGQRQPWKASLAQGRTRAQLADLLRAQAAHRKSLQGALAHRVLGLGNRILTERVDMRSWMVRWGRSVGHRAPGQFQARLAVLAQASGGSLEEIPTGSTCLSSRCLCGRRRKKLLKERRHTCECAHVPEGTWVDRDEFSAFLALHCREGRLDEQAARDSWRAWGAETLLHVSSSPNQAARGQALPVPRGGEPRWSGSQRRDSNAREAPGAPGGERSVEVLNPCGAHAPPGNLVL